MTSSNHFLNVIRSDSAFRPAGPHDIKYLLEKTCPYLQIVGVTELPDMEDESLPLVQSPVDVPSATEEQLSDEIRNMIFGQQLDDGVFGEPALIELSSGWMIHYWRKTETFPPAMCISAGEEIIDKEIASDAPVPGSITNRSFDAAAQLVLLALGREWKGIQIVSGSEMMCWAAWAVARHNRLPCFGYDASAEGEAKADRIEEILAARYAHQPSVSRIPTLGGANASAQDKES